VALPCAQSLPRLRRLHSSWWALLPAGSLVGFVLVAQLAEVGSADVLSYVALVAVPPLAGLALGWLVRGSRPQAAVAVVPLFALAWTDRTGLAGESAALLLSGLSCVALGALIAAVTPGRWLAVGIVAMAIADAALVIADQLQRPDSALSAAHPVASLPRLQVAVFGSASMGYGDLFVAGVLGGLLAVRLGRETQLLGSALVVGLALAFDLLFFFVDELPATVPVAVGLIAIALERRRRVSSRSTRGELCVPAGVPPGESEGGETPDCALPPQLSREPELSGAGELPEPPAPSPQ
jgi:hypothetical protein